MLGGCACLHVLERRNEDVAQANDLLLLETAVRTLRENTHILVPQVLQELQFSVCALRQDRSAKGLHDLFDGDGLAGELVLCRAAGISMPCFHGTVCTYQTRPKAPIPTGCRSVYLHTCQSAPRRKVGLSRAPARNLEGRAKDLCAHELGHGGRWERGAAED